MALCLPISEMIPVGSVDDAELLPLEDNLNREK